MSLGAPTITSDQAEPRTKLRDADNTRQLLLRAARHRFARDGFSKTTVRQIAADAGVNVALINRYFTSKEGLFEACLNYVAKDFEQVGGPRTVDQIVRIVVAQVVASPDGEQAVQLLLLLRSSGDERAEAIRRRILQSASEDMASAAGWHAGDADGEQLLLRAQIALATAVGIVLLRSSTGLEPLGLVGSEELAEPLTELLTLLLTPGA